MKNSNGSGSVYKLKGKRRKPWIARITTGYEDRKQVRKNIGTFETKKEAQRALLDYCDSPMLYSGKTFKDVKEAWWGGYSKKIAVNTVATKKAHLKHLEVLEDLKIRDINLSVLQNLFDGLAMSWGTKSNLRSVLNMVFDYALKYEYIEVNKIHLIDLGVNSKVTIRRVFTKKEIGKLWDCADSENIARAILILIYTGMRIGEFLNLKNADIDLARNIISIRESKTNAGIRTIPISNKIVHLFSQNVNTESEYFTRGMKGKKTYEGFKYTFNGFLKSLGIEKHTIHDTRHTFATLLNNANANSTSIIKLIGHTDFKTTEDIYTHKDIEELRKAVDLLQ